MRKIPMKISKLLISYAKLCKTWLILYDFWLGWRANISIGHENVQKPWKRVFVWTNKYKSLMDIYVLFLSDWVTYILFIDIITNKNSWHWFFHNFTNWICLVYCFIAWIEFISALQYFIWNEIYVWNTISYTMCSYQKNKICRHFMSNVLINWFSIFFRSIQ